MGKVLLLLTSQPPKGGDIFASLLPFILLIGAFYFFILRPANKQRKQLQQLINNLKSGDRVITTGGIYGVVTAVKEKSVILKIADNVKIEVSKNAIAGLQQGSQPPITGK